MKDRRPPIQEHNGICHHGQIRSTTKRGKKGRNYQYLLFISMYLFVLDA
jgi:hypothetical protein